MSQPLSLQTICRACGSNQLFDALDFGSQALANEFRTELQGGQEHFPLLLRVCSRCSLAQLGHVVPKERLYRDYAYVTSTSKTMADHLEAQCRSAIRRINNKVMPRVVEIGSNTGTYLKHFKRYQCRIFGFEPAQNLAAHANMDGIPTISEFFTQSGAVQFQAAHGKADLVVARHVFAHIDCWRAFMSALDSICAPTGLIAIEVPYLLDLFENFQFDTIYHEHLSFVSVRALDALLEDSPFYLYDAERCPIHGGSVVFYLHRRPVIPSKRSIALEHLRTLESNAGLTLPETWKTWAKSVETLKEEIRDAVGMHFPDGVAGFGASAKGSMLVQYCGLEHLLRFVVDNTPYKQHRFMPGADILICEPEQLAMAVKKGGVKTVLLLAWNFEREIRANNNHLGVQWITPIPRVRVS